jgi:hypothetical protein
MREQVFIDRFILHWLPGRPQRCIARFQIPEIPLRRPAVALPVAS